MRCRRFAAFAESLAKVGVPAQFVLCLHPIVRDDVQPGSSGFVFDYRKLLRAAVCGTAQLCER